MRTRTRIIAAVATALAPVTIAVVVTVATRGGDERPAATGPRVDAGTTFRARTQVDDTDHRSSVLLPTGRVRIGVDDPTDRWVYDERAAAAGERATARPPLGGSVVLVTWSFEAGYDEARSQDAAFVDAPREFDSLALVAGGARHVLVSPGADRWGGSAAVAVDGDGKDSRIEVGYDRVVQSVDARTGRRTTGRAAPLYGRTVLGTGNCGTPMIAAPAAGVPGAPYACEYRVRRLAYLTGPGWAPDGRVWLVIELNYDADDITLVRAGREQRYEIGYLDTPTAVVGGADGREADTNWRSGYRSALYYSIPRASALPAAITVGQTFSVTPARDRDAGGVRLAVSWRLPLR